MIVRDSIHRSTSNLVQLHVVQNAETKSNHTCSGSQRQPNT
jgi:hypothetical protein